jgi:IS5 family transposase
MEHQLSLVDTDYSRPHKQVRREVFLSQMERVVPWKKLMQIIEPFYPKAGNGRQPYPLEQMLRIYCLQLWYNLSDPLMEESLYDVISMRSFARVDIVKSKAPDETTIGNFRRLIEDNSLGKQIFDTINTHLIANGVRLSMGTIVDATIIEAPSSTKNKDHQRDPEMQSTKKGNQWHFGMKAHIGVDAKSKLIHSVEVTSANVHDSTMIDKLIRSTDTAVYGDKAYVGKTKEIREKAPLAKSKIIHKAKRGKQISVSQEKQNKSRAKVRARVEHCFGVMKNIFGFKKVRYRGLSKNGNKVYMTCGLINLYMSRSKLLPTYT